MHPSTRVGSLMLLMHMPSQKFGAEICANAFHRRLDKPSTVLGENFDSIFQATSGTLEVLNLGMLSSYSHRTSLVQGRGTSDHLHNASSWEIVRICRFFLDLHVALGIVVSPQLEPGDIQ